MFFCVFFLKVVDLLLRYHSYLVRQIPHLEGLGCTQALLTARAKGERLEIQPQSDPAFNGSASPLYSDTKTGLEQLGVVFKRQL